MLHKHVLFTLRTQTRFTYLGIVPEQITIRLPESKQERFHQMMDSLLNDGKSNFDKTDFPAEDFFYIPKGLFADDDGQEIKSSFFVNKDYIWGISISGAVDYEGAKEEPIIYYPDVPSNNKVFNICDNRWFL